ncbi:hypothetical protein RB213_010915 [Colletotrichum asianum]
MRILTPIANTVQTLTDCHLASETGQERQASVVFFFRTGHYAAKDSFAGDVSLPYSYERLTSTHR